jgi:hypothetical protein
MSEFDNDKKDKGVFLPLVFGLGVFFVIIFLVVNGNSYRSTSTNTKETQVNEIRTDEEICNKLDQELQKLKNDDDNQSSEWQATNERLASNDEGYADALQDYPELNSPNIDSGNFGDRARKVQQIFNAVKIYASGSSLEYELNTIQENWGNKVIFSQMKPSPEKGEFADELLKSEQDAQRAELALSKTCGYKLLGSNIVGSVEGK